MVREIDDWSMSLVIWSKWVQKGIQSNASLLFFTCVMSPGQEKRLQLDNTARPSLLLDWFWYQIPINAEGVAVLSNCNLFSWLGLITHVKKSSEALLSFPVCTHLLQLQSKNSLIGTRAKNNGREVQPFEIWSKWVQRGNAIDWFHSLIFTRAKNNRREAQPFVIRPPPDIAVFGCYLILQPMLHANKDFYLWHDHFHSIVEVQDYSSLSSQNTDW